MLALVPRSAEFSLLVRFANAEEWKVCQNLQLLAIRMGKVDNSECAYKHSKTPAR